MTTPAFAPRSKFELRAAIDACVRLNHPNEDDCLNSLDGVVLNPDAAGNFCGVFDNWLQRSFSVNMQQRADYKREVRAAADTIVKLNGPTLLEFKKRIDIMGYVVFSFWIAAQTFVVHYYHDASVSANNAFDSALML